MNYEAIKFALIDGFGPNALTDFSVEPITFESMGAISGRTALFARSKKTDTAYLLFDDSRRDFEMSSHLYLDLAKHLCNQKQEFYTPAQSLPAKVLLSAKPAGAVQAFKFRIL